MSHLVAFTIVLAACAPAAISADEASLDSMWMDQKTGATDTAGATKGATSDTAVQATSAHPAATTESATSSSDTVAPMCTVDAFKSSALVSKGGWPGVGPFKQSADAADEFVDANENKIKLEVNGGQITHAELVLSGKQSRQTTQKDLLAVEMHIDFLLEACGIKPKKIEGLNEQLGKSKDAILRDQTAVSLTAGRCQVTVQPQAAGAGGYVIAVNSLDANKSVLKQHSGLADDQPKKHDSNQDVATFIMPDASKQTSTKESATKASAAVASKSALKGQFADVINEWQRVKKSAVRNKQIDDLSSILSGKALARQTDAIKWLQTNKKYYDMTPKAVVVDQFSELATGKKYMVSAQVHEAYKYIDEPTGKVLKEVDDINKVNYTIEKVDDKWLITDSALLSTATKTSSANKGSH